MASSIKVGLNHISNTSESFFICLGDMPMIKPDIYNQLIKSRNQKDILIPTYNGQQGNPVLFNKSDLIFSSITGLGVSSINF